MSAQVRELEEKAKVTEDCSSSSEEVAKLLQEIANLEKKLEDTKYSHKAEVNNYEKYIEEADAELHAVTEQKKSVEEELTQLRKGRYCAV